MLLHFTSYSQEIGIAPIKIWTNNIEIGNPAGFGVYFFQPIGRLGIKLEYVLSTGNSRSYYGILNGGFLLSPEEYIYDSVSIKSKFHAFELSLHLPKLFELFKNNFNIGAGVTFDYFSQEKKGLNNGQKLSTDENKPGFFYSFSISRENFFNLPFKLELLFKHKALRSGSFATDTEQPFTDAIDVKELQLNLGYIF